MSDKTDMGPDEQLDKIAELLYGMESRLMARIDQIGGVRGELSPDLLRLRDAIAASIAFQSDVPFETEEVIADGRVNHTLQEALDRVGATSAAKLWPILRRIAHGRQDGPVRLVRDDQSRAWRIDVDP